MRNGVLILKKFKGSICKASSGNVDIYRVVPDVPTTRAQQHHDCTIELGGYRWSLSDMAHSE
jgi:hypothetical protein